MNSQQSFSVGVLTSTETRHRYFARQMVTHLPVSAIGYEHTGYSPADPDLYNLTEPEKQILEKHFSDRARIEMEFFGHDSEKLSSDELYSTNNEGTVFDINQGELNTDQTLKNLENARVDALIIYGTNLIKEPILSRYAGKMINLHLGLSPFYRGTATNFYPLFNEEPEYIGATIHLIDPGIDSGPIIRHARPEIKSDDSPHSIGCRAIQAGIDAIIRSVNELAKENMQITPQSELAVRFPEPSRLYLRKNYHPRQVIEVYEKIENGLIENYCRQPVSPEGLID